MVLQDLQQPPRSITEPKVTGALIRSLPRAVLRRACVQYSAARTCSRMMRHWSR